MDYPRRILLLFALTLALTSLQIAAAEEYQPGKTYFGKSEYIEYLAGDLPVILSAPHGGRLRPEEIPDRTAGTIAFDTNTQELARAIADELHARTGHWPHIIICRLSRRKVDCNREIVEAAAGNPRAEQAWRDFQGFIDAAQASVVRQRGRGIYIDLHGHGHAAPRLELGYLHSVEQLALSDAELNAGTYAADSSLAAIAALNRRSSYADLLRGPLSFGAIMEQHGFLCSPSPSNPHPKAPFFSGGYNTRRHGHDAAPLAGLQIETNSRGVRDTPANRAKFAKALADTLEIFLEANVGITLLPATPPAAIEVAPLASPARCEVGRRRRLCWWRRMRGCR
jgi:N-formylglutamate amidohydrolase